MHELSIATNVVALATDHAAAHPNASIAAVTLRIGQLSCVHEDALRTAFAIAREGTPLAEAELRIITVPVIVWCPTCRAERQLPGIQRLACPACGQPTGDIRGGRELDLESLDLVETADA
jgi:hydrogenase nickel incorporation protein HypA/HybF